MQRDKVLVTGGSGFVGKHIVEQLQRLKIPSVVTIRENKSVQDISSHFVPHIDKSTDWSNVLLGVDCVIHCAARVHAMNEGSLSLLEDYCEVNTSGTINLAKQAVKAGVTRFIFISSIKVNGEFSTIGNPFRHDDPKRPKDDYARSKFSAEELLLQLAGETALEVVIIRPTLVYGPGVKANFASLMNLINLGVPLPVGCIKDNRRSLVSVTNLVDLIITCIDHPNAVNQTFLVSDDNDISTSVMVSKMAKQLGKRQWQLPVPKWCYELIGRLLGKQDVVDRLLGSLQVDISYTRESLNWAPPQSLDEGFKQTAQTFLKSK